MVTILQKLCNPAGSKTISGQKNQKQSGGEDSAY